MRPSHFSRRIFLCASALSIGGLGVFGAPGGAFAARSSEQAEQIVGGVVEAIWKVLKAPDLAQDERVQQVADIIRTDTNTELLGRLALGRHWRTLSEDQQAQYMESFPPYITRTLARQLITAAGDVQGTLDDNFQLLQSQQVDENDIVVRSSITRAQGQPVTVDWRLREVEGGSAIIDLLIDGVSLLMTQRNQFAAAIERGSVQDMLAQLETGSES